MKPITEYQDYRRFMQDFYEEKKKSGFTWREFSKEAGFASPSYLKLVCEGKSSLSRVGLPRVANAMGLTGFERTYFEKMVEFGNATNDEKKKAAFAELTRIAKEQKARVIDADTFAYYESAVNSIVRELAPLMPGALPNEMAKRIKHLYTAQQVRDSLAMLTRAKFLEEKAPRYHNILTLDRRKIFWGHLAFLAHFLPSPPNDDFVTFAIIACTCL